MKIDEKTLDKYIFLSLRLLFLLSYGVAVLIIAKFIIDIIIN